MKLSNHSSSRRFLFSSFLITLLSLLSVRVVQANPYASCVTNDNGTIRFVINESGGTVTVVYDNGTTNGTFDGVSPTAVNVAAGSYSFPIGAASGYQIIIHKDGTGSPSQTTTDQTSAHLGAPFNYFNSPRGVDVNVNPKIGYLFGRTYIGNSANSANAGGRRVGIYALTPDFNNIIGIGGVTTNIAGGQFVGPFAPDQFVGNLSSPWKLKVGKDDNNVYASCFGTSGGGVLQFGPSFEYTNVLFNPFGENQGISRQTHSDTIGVYTTGSTAAGNLTVWTFDPTLSAPDTNGLTFPYPPIPNTSHPTLGVGGPMGVGGYGPTINGDYNMVFRYDVGAGETVHYALLNVWTNTTGGAPDPTGGGSRYTVGDVLSIVGGTYASSNYFNFGMVTSKVVVTAIAGAGPTGPISILQIATNGDYTTPPTSPVTVTGGTGSNAVLNVFYPQIIWSGRPNFAEGLGLPGFPDTVVGDMTLGTDGKIFALFRRANLSDGCIQGFDPAQAGTPRVYDSLKLNAAGALFESMNGPGGGADNPYAGVACSPDSKYLAAATINGSINVALLTNGLPDDASLVNIVNGPAAGNARGLSWDAAGNLIWVSSGVAEARAITLGNSSTCITSNDITMTNGTFSLALPRVSASLAAVTPTASQNYINSPPPGNGTPIPGVLRISLTTNNLTAPLTVNFALSGTAVQGTHYTINNTNAGTGISIAANSVTFPIGAFTGVGNYYADITITPTATPLFTNTLIVNMTVVSSANYLRIAPVVGTVNILNTGPQVLILTPIANFNTMYRGTSNDFGSFTISRLGDTNGPSNNATSAVVARSFTLTNFVYTGTAVYPTDYKARAQNLNISNPNSKPIDGDFGIVIHAGDTVITNVVGNPVYHGDIYTPPVNATIIVSQTNATPVGGDNTNLLSSEGLPYTVVAANAALLTILDNRTGPETVLWSSPLTNSLDSTNWTLTFAATNTPAIVYSNYVSGTPFDGIHDYQVNFGFDPSTENSVFVPPSPTMVASNWNGVLRMTVNKNDTLSAAGVNLYPQQTFGGNYALRFNMYLSMMNAAKGNQFIGSLPREFAAFGLNHFATNANWRIASPINNRPDNSGYDRTNTDGIWYCVDAATGSQTPADYDGFQGLPIPNAGKADTVSFSAPFFRGIFKSPPFSTQLPFSFDPTRVGGEPINRWVDVSMQVTTQTNCSLVMNGTTVMSMPITNGLTQGAAMLGYLDPVGNNSDDSAFVYYSNVRVVELSPFLAASGRTMTSAGQTNYLVAQGSSLTFTSGIAYASAPLTNKWFRGTGNNQTINPGVPTALLQSNSVNASTMNDSYTQVFNGAVNASNYMNVASDTSGSITSRVVAVTIVLNPANKTFGAGSTNRLTTTIPGPSAPTSQGWSFNTTSNFATATRLVAGPHYGTPTTTSLWLTNITSADVGFYWIGATNTAITNGVNFAVAQAAVLGITNPPPTITSISASGGNTTMHFTSVNQNDSGASYTLQSAGVVTGPYTNDPSATFSGTYPNLQVVAPQNGDQMFYRLLHN